MIIREFTLLSMTTTTLINNGYGDGDRVLVERKGKLLAETIIIRSSIRRRLIARAISQLHIDGSPQWVLSGWQ